MGSTQHNKGNKVTWEEYGHYLFWALVLGLAVTFWCSCSASRLNQKSWNQVLRVRQAEEVLAKDLEPQAMESGIFCHNQHGSNQIEKQLCLHQSPSVQAHFAWSVIGHRIVKRCLSNAIEDLVLADKVRGRVQTDTYLNGCRCLLKQFDKRWGAVLSRARRKIVQRAYAGVVCKSR